jgi:hypothetical protein
MIDLKKKIVDKINEIIIMLLNYPYYPYFEIDE